MLKSLKSAAAAVVMTLAATSGMVALTSAPASAAQRSAYANQMESAIISATNNQRAAAGVGAVSANSCIDGYAEKWATHLAANNLFQHRTDLRSILGSCNRSYVSENLAKYPVSSRMSAGQMARNTVALWMNSPGHKANLISPRARTIGVGVSKSADGKYWLITQNFTS